ncbi:Neuronal acetylcholine receptor subunit alpha-2 [Holothuria leucospilota]|uniref:Neuronal acetylcholine receptor subunit alpha-2 n=1 Tax=Holothuria leucospilota TaxID=206669 RepID=A0A9Q1CJ75_HOLLE|nr:Neuronal acetylcholine receptor subunit alpha-2 [Holothuria leucospilota]
MTSCWMLSGLLILSMSGLSAANVEGETRLKGLLFSHYDKTVAPETPLVLTFSTALKKLVDANPDKGLVTVDLFLSQSWQDSRLAWDPQEFNVTDQSIIVPREWVFLPDMKLQNGFVTELLADPEVLIYSNGGAYYVPYVRAEVYCDLPSKPFEGLICDVRIGPWSRTSNRITIESFTVDDSAVQLGGQCTLGKSEAKIVRQLFPCCPETYEAAILSLNVSCQAPESSFPVAKVNVTCELVNPAPNSAVESHYLFPYFFVAPIYIVLHSLTGLLG